MKLKLLTPNRVLVDQQVVKVVAEAEDGCFCLLPNHVDFLAGLAPSLLSYETEEGRERFAALGEGLLVKRGEEVLVSAQQAVLGSDLGELRRTVAEEFRILDEKAKTAHSAVARLEASFLRGYLELTERTL